MSERNPDAMTAKFSGMKLGPGLLSPVGPFRVVLIREGSKYDAFLCPTGGKIGVKRGYLETVRDNVKALFEKQLEEWTECEPRKGLAV